jgi:hypothetical protein
LKGFGRVFGIGIARWLSENLPEPWNTIVMILIPVPAAALVVYGIIIVIKGRKRKSTD